MSSNCYSLRARLPEFITNAKYSLMIVTFFRKEVKNVLIFINLNWLIGELKSQIFEKIPFIEPDNKWKIFWDFFILFIYLCLFFIMSIQISFNLIIIQEIFSEKETLQKFVQVFLNAIIFLDIILKFITAYYQKRNPS